MVEISSTTALVDSQPSWLTHPTFFNTIQMTTIALIIGFTSSSSMIRFAVLPVMLGMVWLIIPKCLDRTGKRFEAHQLGANIMMHLFQYIEVALLSNWSFEAGGPNRYSATPGRLQETKRAGDNGDDVDEKSPVKRVLKRLRFGLHVAFSPRMTGTLYEVKNVPPFSTADPSYVPTRAAFLAKTARTVLLSHFVLDVLDLNRNRSEKNFILFSPQEIPLLARVRELTYEQALLRTMTTLRFWIRIYCLVQRFQGLAALVTVAVGLDEVKSWRPAFGSLTDAYTIRRFWGVFWHQWNRQRLSGPARFITDNIFNLPKGTLASRYTHLFLTFLLSGLMHAPMDTAQGIPWDQSGAVQFFCTQAVGIMFEDAIQALYRSWRGVERSKASPPPAWARLIGYTWMIAFLIWTTPIWSYPSLMRNEGGEKDRIVRFSFVTTMTRLIR